MIYDCIHLEIPIVDGLLRCWVPQHIDRHGIGKIMEMTLDHLAKKVPCSRRVHLDALLQ